MREPGRCALPSGRERRQPDLRQRIRTALCELGQGFIAHPESEELRHSLRSGRLDPEELYRQLVRLVYRLLVLFTLADHARCSLPRNLGRLRDTGATTGDVDVWPDLLAAFHALGRRSAGDSDASPLPGLQIFSAEACAQLEAARCDRDRLMTALLLLSTTSDRSSRRPLDFTRLAVEELGAIYAGLLAYHPRVVLDPHPRFEVTDGSDRKRMGTYYTPSELVDELLRSTLLPVVRKRLASSAPAERERAVLGLRICDPAAGSGCLLLPAARRLAHELARIRLGRANPPPAAVHDALGEVIRQCLYAVDRDPLAVDLCKLALWLETPPGLDLASSLDEHVRCGNALVGVVDPTVLDPGSATPQNGDELRTACDRWTAALVLPRSRTAPQGRHRTAVARTHPVSIPDGAIELASRHGFFHWPLAFPEVFASGGFDVVLANPPWELLQPEEKHFFTGRDETGIARLPGRERKAAIGRLSVEAPHLAARWREHRHAIEGEVRFIRGSGRYPASAGGKVNTYGAFVETVRAILHPSGRAGCVVPSGLVTDHSARRLFRAMLDSRTLVSLYHFDNRRTLFPGVGSAVTFCLLTLRGSPDKRTRSRFAFFLHGADELRDPDRHIRLTGEHIVGISPNTGTCPIIRTASDARRLIDVHRRVPILVRDVPEENPWKVEMRQGLFNMTADAHLFRSGDLAAGESDPSGTIQEGGAPFWLPLYEAKMMHHYDHRWAHASRLPGEPAPRKDSPFTSARPRYWVARTEVEARMRGRWEQAWAIGCRLICRSTDERTVISTILPRAGYGNSVLLLFPRAGEPEHLACFVASLNSYILDYLARQKLGGINLNFHILKQLPVLPPSAYDVPAPGELRERISGWLARRVLELVYTSWDLEPFARFLGYAGAPFPWGEQRRFLLRCEIEAALFHLYGMSRHDVISVLDTFPITRRKEVVRLGEYRSRRTILQAYDGMRLSGRS